MKLRYTNRTQLENVLTRVLNNYLENIDVEQHYIENGENYFILKVKHIEKIVTDVSTLTAEAILEK